MVNKIWKKKRYRHAHRCRFHRLERHMEQLRNLYEERLLKIHDNSVLQGVSLKSYFVVFTVSII